MPALLLVADFTQYWVHRTFHAVSFLWPFHAIHHSVEEMDWLAGSRLHLVDVIVTRGLTYVPIFLLGFSERALMVYVFLVAAQATFIHANVRWEFRPLRRLVATPAFHHWHHSAEREAIDKNFAVHTPIWDILFGTYYLPDRWPSAYGLSGRTRRSGALADAAGLPVPAAQGVACRSTEVVMGLLDGLMGNASEIDVATVAEEFKQILRAG